MRESRASQANAGVEAQRRAEEAERAAAAEAQSRRRDPAAALNGPAGVVELGPLDKTLKVKWLKSVHPALDSPAAVSTFFRTALAPLDPDIDSAVLSSKTLANPSKGKFGSGVVAFKSLSAANRAIKGKRADPEGLWKGFEVDWAAGTPPAALGGDAGRAPTKAASSHGATGSPPSVASPAPAPAAHVSLDVLSWSARGCAREAALKLNSARAETATASVGRRRNLGKTSAAGTGAGTVDGGDAETR